MFCLSCGSALDHLNWCAHCEAFADTAVRGENAEPTPDDGDGDGKE